MSTVEHILAGTIFPRTPPVIIAAQGHTWTRDLIFAELQQTCEFVQIQSNISFLEQKLQMNPESVRSAVSIDRNIMHGNPVFRGTRIPLYQIVEELAEGTTLQDIVEGYPSLNVEKIQSGLDFVSSLLQIYNVQIPRR